MPEIKTPEEFALLNPRAKIARILFDMGKNIATEELSDDELVGRLLSELGIDLGFIAENYHLIQTISENEATLAEVQNVCNQ